MLVQFSNGGLLERGIFKGKANSRVYGIGVDIPDSHALFFYIYILLNTCGWELRDS